MVRTMVSTSELSELFRLLVECSPAQPWVATLLCTHTMVADPEQGWVGGRPASSALIDADAYLHLSVNTYGAGRALLMVMVIRGRGRTGFCCLCEALHCHVAVKQRQPRGLGLGDRLTLRFNHS